MLTLATDRQWRFQAEVPVNGETRSVGFYAGPPITRDTILSFAVPDDVLTLQGAPQARFNGDTWEPGTGALHLAIRDCQ